MDHLEYTGTPRGFVINPYDPCVANMIVNGAQITVCWNVDDIKISHRDEEVVSAFAIQISETYGPKTIISRGKVYDYLSMHLDFGTCPGSMIISMIKYLQKILDEWPEVLGGTKAAPQQTTCSRSGKTRIGYSSVKRWRGSSTVRQPNFCFFVRERDRTLRRWCHS